MNLQCDKVCNANDGSLKHPPSFVYDEISAGTFWKSEKLRISRCFTARYWKNFFALSICGDFLSRTTGCDVLFEVQTTQE